MRLVYGCRCSRWDAYTVQPSTRGRTDQQTLDWRYYLIPCLHSSSSKRIIIASLDRARISVIMRELDREHTDRDHATHWSWSCMSMTLMPRIKQETHLRRCTKPNIDRLEKASHFWALDARHASAASVQMQKSRKPLYRRAKIQNTDIYVRRSNNVLNFYAHCSRYVCCSNTIILLLNTICGVTYMDYKYIFPKKKFF